MLVAILLCLVGVGCVQRIVPGTVTTLDLPLGSRVTSASLGHDGRLWFGFAGGASLEPGLGSIGTEGSLETFQLPPVSQGFDVNDVAVTQDGTIWAAFDCYCPGPGYASFSSRPGSLTKIFPLGRRSGPDGISIAPDGSVWISERQANAVAHVTRAGQASTISLGDPKFAPSWLVATSDHVVVAGLTPGKLALIDREGKVHALHVPSQASHVSNVAIGPDGRIWMAEFEANTIVSIDSRGAVREYAIPSRDSKPTAVDVDSHGIVWFVESDADRLGQIGPDGTVREAMLPDGVSLPDFLFVGPGDMLYVLGSTNHWFGMYRTFVIARIPAATAFP